MKQWTARLLSFDQQISAWLVQKIRHYKPAYFLCAILAHSGDGVLVVLVGLIAYACGDAQLRTALLQLLISIVAVAVLVATLKYAIRRDRPREQDSAKWSAMPKYDRYAFPSGLAARVMGVAMVLGEAYPALQWALVLWAISVSLARVAVGAHHLSDVIGGSVLGIGVSYLVNLAMPTT